MIRIELYIKEITRFLSTMTIKNNYFKDQMEDQWVADYYKGKLPDSAHPYYHHLMGEYILKDLSTFRANTGTTYDDMSDDEICELYGLSLSTDIGGTIVPNSELYSTFDDLIIINSVDTKQPVPFTKKMLSSRQHQKTATLYRMPSRYYEKIRTRFSAQADLIKAIVYPVESLTSCVIAPNYGLISCDLTQLKENERSSMYSCVCETLAVVQRRWDVPDFVYEDLYALSIQAKIWDILLLALMERRVKNIRTSAAHEYHIWEYLKSKGYGDYSDVLSLKQAVFLYRNFPYLLRNRGTEKNLLLLAHKLLSDWDIVINHKNLLQQTACEAGEFLDRQQDGKYPSHMREVTKSGGEKLSMVESCETFPVIDSVEIGRSVLDRLRTIDNLDENPMTTYHNKTLKFKDELDALDEQTNDLQEMSLGKVETLEETFDSEQESGIEYQNEHLFERSTSDQRTKFTRTPHTYLPTKLLEITKAETSSLFQQIYARFVTESLIYQTATKNLDHYISFIPDGLSYSIDITIKEAIALVIYCALKETGNYVEGMGLSKSHLLTMAYKSEFPSIKEEYEWNSFVQKTKNLLSVIPLHITLKSDDLDAKYKGEYYLSNPDADIVDWIWNNSLGSTLQCHEEYGEYYWTLTNGTSILRSTLCTPYRNWHYWEMVWEYGSFEYSSTLVVDDYEYTIDKYMPVDYDQVLDCDWYTLRFKSGVSDYDKVVELINAQAEGYIKIYREIHGSDWSRQRAVANQIMTDRMFNGVIELDLMDGKTFDDFILSASGDLKTVLNKIESEAEDVRRTEYAKFGNSIIRALLPIESEYFLDNAGVAANRFKRLKELFTNLCSYNITFLEGSIGSEDYSMIAPGYTTQDMIQMEMGWDICDQIAVVDTAPLVMQHCEFLPLEQISVGSQMSEQPLFTPFHIGVSGDKYAAFIDAEDSRVDSAIRSKYADILYAGQPFAPQLLPASTEMKRDSNYQKLAEFITNKYKIKFDTIENWYPTLGEVVEHVQQALTNQLLTTETIFRDTVSIDYGIFSGCYHTVAPITATVTNTNVVVETE